MYTAPPVSTTALLRLPDVMRETGCARSTVWNHAKHGLLPRPVRLSPRTVGWPAGEIAAVNAARIAGSDDEGIRALVDTLHSQRRNAGDTGEQPEPPAPPPRGKVSPIRRTPKNAG